MRPDFYLIGFGGRAWSGKDTAANFLVEGDGGSLHDGVPWRRMGFADPLKAAVQIMFMFSDGQMNDRVLKETVDPRWGFTPRFALQKVGTEVGRHTREDVWIQNLDMRYQPLREAGRHVVVSDVRFVNEADYIHKHGGKVFRLQRDPAKTPYPNIDATHPSEVELNKIPWDAVISNDEQLSDLRDAVWRTVQMHLLKKEW